MSNASTTPAFQLFKSPRLQPNPISEWENSDPKLASGRQLAEQLRPEHCAPCTPKETFDQWAARVLPAVPSVRSYPYIDPPVAPTGPAVTPTADTSIPTAPASGAPTELDKHGWALLFWVTGLVVWFRHPQFFTHWVVFAGVVFLIAPAKYLIRTALLIGAGWFLLHKYQVL